MKKFMTYFTLLNISIMAALALLIPPGKAAAEDPGGLLEFAAVNPGYTVDGVSNSGEVIVLRRKGGDEVLLTGFKIEYTNSKGNTSVLLDFPDGAVMTGEELQLRLASSSEGADLRYTKTLATIGGLTLFYGDEEVDAVCWTGEEGCAAKFNTDEGKRTTLARTEDGWEHEKDYVINYTGAGISIPAKNEDEVSVCRGLIFSEILTYYESEKTEQFVEFYNASADQVGVDGCALRYKGKLYGLSGIVRPGGFLVFYPAGIGLTLTKNPSSENSLELIDANGDVLDTLIYRNGQKKGVALAQFGYTADGGEQWLQTYRPTPGEENDFQKFKTCEAGKVINEETGNCVKDSTLDSTLEACPEGKYRNPLTGRCKSYSSSSEQKECAEGYERNPETNRCRKIKKNTGAEYGLEMEQYENKTNFVAIGAVAGIVGVGALYTLWQFRREIGKFCRKIFGRGFPGRGAGGGHAGGAGGAAEKAG